MEDLFALFIVAAMIWSAIGGVLGKKGKGRVEPSSPRQGAERPAERPSVPEHEPPDYGDAYASPPVEAQGESGSEGRAAADMIPGDLWEILTGERRVPLPERESEWESDEPLSEESWSDEAELPAGPYGREAETLEEMPLLDEPVVVSLETPPSPPEVRHRNFRERLDASPPVRRNSRPLTLHAGLRGRSELRRAVILSEVLGPPKALE